MRLFYTIAVCLTLARFQVTIAQRQALFIKTLATENENGKRVARQTSADQMVQNILQWLQGVYTQNSRRIRQGTLREYLPPINTQKPRPFEPVIQGTQRPNNYKDGDNNIINGGYPESGSISPKPPFIDGYPSVHPEITPPDFSGYPTPSRPETSYPTTTNQYPGTFPVGPIGSTKPTEFPNTGYPTNGYPSGPSTAYPNTGYPGQSTSFTSSTTVYPKPSTSYPSPNTNYPSSTTGYPTPSSNTGYPNPSTNYPSQNQYSSTTGHPGFSTSYPYPSTNNLSTSGYPSSSTSYANPTTSYPNPSTGFPAYTSSSTSLPSYTPGYPTSNAGFPTSNTNYPSSTSGYPTSNAGFPTSNTNYPSSTPGYPTSNAGFPSSNTNYPSSTSGYFTPSVTDFRPSEHTSPSYTTQKPTTYETQPPYTNYPQTTIYPSSSTPTQEENTIPSKGPNLSTPQDHTSLDTEHTTIVAPLDDDLNHPPHIHAIDVDCSKEMMTINIEFNRQFDGVIYSKGHYHTPECRYVKENSGKTKYKFTVSLNSCGTEFINAFDTQGKSYLENVLVLQNEPGIQEVWDTIRSVRCLWEGNLKKVLNVALSVGMLNQEIVTFSGDTAMARLDIQLGKGPFAPSANGLVKIGEVMTLVVSVSGDPGFDIQVKDCRAKDSSGENVVALTDNRGCILKPKLFGAFQKTRNTGNTGASIIAYAYFNAFKFPDVMDLTLECNVDLCKTDCEVCPDSGRRRKRNVYYQNYTNENDNSVKMGKILRVILPEDLNNGKTTINFTESEGICMSTQGFVFSSALLTSLLTSSCLFSAYIWLKYQRLNYKK